MRLSSSQARWQQTRLAGNVLDGLRVLSESYTSAVSSTVPYPCELGIPAVFPSSSELLMGKCHPVFSTSKAKPREFSHFRVWFRTGEELEKEQRGQLVRAISNEGLVDPWGELFGFKLDTDYNGKIRVMVLDMEQLQEQTVYKTVAVWSKGPDMENETRDDIRSWD